MRKPSRKFLLKAGATAILLALWAGLCFQDRFRIGLDQQSTPCLDAHVFLWDTKDREPVVGNIYVFKEKMVSPKPPHEVRGLLMAKRLAAVEGDKVKLDQNGILTINGNVAKEGVPLLRFIGKKPSDIAFNRTLGENELFFLGDTPDSFDSRYGKTIDKSAVIGRAYVLF